MFVRFHEGDFLRNIAMPSHPHIMCIAESMTEVLVVAIVNFANSHVFMVSREVVCVPLYVGFCGTLWFLCVECFYEFTLWA